MRNGKYRSLILPLGGSCILGVGVAFFLAAVLENSLPSELSQAFANISTVAGTISGLSIVAAGIFTLSSSYTQHIRDEFGPFINAVIFLGFGLLVLIAIINAVASALSSIPGIYWILAVSVPALLLILVLTVMFVKQVLTSDARSVTHNAEISRRNNYGPLGDSSASARRLE